MSAGFVVLLSTVAVAVHSLDNGVALRPPLVISTQLAFCDPAKKLNDSQRCENYCTEALIKDAADQIVSQKLLDAGWSTLLVADCWQGFGRDANGSLETNVTRFPSGMKVVVDYIHAKGLKVGLTLSIGNKTCSGIGAGLSACPLYTPGDDLSSALPCATQDAKTFAGWGIDWLDVHDCFNTGADVQSQYTAWALAVNATGRATVINVISPSLYAVMHSVATVGDAWVVDGDHENQWASAGNAVGIADAISNQIGRVRANQSGVPGAWNSLGLLRTGLLLPPSMHWRTIPSAPLPTPTASRLRAPPAPSPPTRDEYITEFTFWSLLQSPLIWTGNVSCLGEVAQEVLLNTDVLAVNQDVCAGSLQGDLLVNVSSTLQIWGRKMCEGSYVGVLLNLAPQLQNITVPFTAFNFKATDSVIVKDLWARTSSKHIENTSLPVPGHGSVMIKASLA